MSKVPNRRITLYIATDYKMYPPTVNAANLLADAGWQVTILALRFASDPDFMALRPEIVVHYLDRHRRGIANVLQYFYCHCRLLVHCLIHRPRWVIAYDAMALSPAIFAGKLTGTRVIYHQHDFWESASGWLRLPWRLEYLLGRFTDLISFPQAERLAIYRERAGLPIQHPCLLIHNAPRREWGNRAKPQTRMAEIVAVHPRTLIYQGGLSRRFSLQNIIAAMRFLPDKYALCILGKKLEAKIDEFYQQEIERAGLTERVFLLGHASYDDLPRFTSQAAAGVANFTYQATETINNTKLAGASNKLAEYMACGLPIIAPDTPTNRDFFARYQCGVLVRPDSPEAIADGIRQLFSDPERYAAMRKHNRMLFEEQFCYDRQWEPLQKWIEDNK